MSYTQSGGGGGAIEVKAPTTIYTGQITIAVTAAAISATNVTIKSITIEAPSTNAGAVYVGDSTVTTATGYAIRAGASVSFDIDNLAKVYVIGTAADVVTYIAVA